MPEGGPDLQSVRRWGQASYAGAGVVGRSIRCPAGLAGG